jgi:aminopeptidase N
MPWGSSARARMLWGAVCAAAFVAAALPAAAQGPYEQIHGDILRKMEAMRAQSSRAPGPLLAPQPTPNQLLYDAVSYVIDIAMNPTTKYITGRVVASITPVSETLYSADFNLDDVFAVAETREAGGRTLAMQHTPGIITVSFPGGIAPGDTVDIEILYTGYPETAADPGLHFSSYGVSPVIFSLSEPWSARAWWPCKDYADDKATFDIYFSVPASLTAASNGTYMGYTEETQWGAPYRKYHWHESYPMATYLASIAASNYTILTDSFVYAPGDTMPITHYVYPSLAANAQIDFNITVPALTFFSEMFGTYPFAAEKFGHALCPLGGGMEHQTLTSYGSFLIRGDHYYDYILVHELSHQWFGDMITCKNWVHVWLNEGFASYCEALWFEHLQGPSKLKSYMEGKDRPLLWNGPILRDPDVTDPWYYFDNVVYNKAAWVLHMLRHVTGDSTFFDILKDWCSDPERRYGAAETNDFVAVCEARYGASLGWFFNEWLTRTDRLGYQWSHKEYELNGATNVTIAVDQVQDLLYTMPVDFRITTTSGVMDTVFWIDERHEEFHLSFPLDDPVIDVAFDPGHWILCDKNEVTTEASAPAAVAFLDQNFPNPFNPQTVIRFGLAAPSRVVLQVFDSRGALLRTLVNGERPAGTQEVRWNGADERGASLPSGIYFYRLTTGSTEISRKMILLR